MHKVGNPDWCVFPYKYSKEKLIVLAKSYHGNRCNSHLQQHYITEVVRKNCTTIFFLRILQETAWQWCPCRYQPQLNSNTPQT